MTPERPRRSWLLAAGAVLLCLPFHWLSAVPASAQDFDLLIRNGRVVDGSGNPDVRADVGIRGDRIAAVGDLRGRTAGRVIDATGLMVVPGFIDIHSHADRQLAGDDPALRSASNLVAQGITTIVGGPDGRNADWPIAAEMAGIARLGVGVNFVPMVGHGTVRLQVMGDDHARAATPGEVRRMADLVRQGMEEGAWGLGAAPEYRPGRFATTEELVELARVVADYDGFYFSHQRSQAPLPQWQYPSMVRGMPEIGFEGMKETIRIGREAGIRVVGSHIKAKGTDVWGWSAADVIQIDRARAEGVQVFLDQYPYETFGGGTHTMILPWAFAPPGTDYSGGDDDPQWRQEGIFDDWRENLRRNLADPAFGPALRGDLEYLLRRRGGPDRLFVMDAPFDPRLVGKTLAQLADSLGMEPVDAMVHLSLEHGTPRVRTGVQFRAVAGHASDVRRYMEQDYTATSTDGEIALRARPGQHPRSWGAFVRKISRYAKEEGAISLPFAVRSNTSLPALIVGLRDRGLVREGYFADLVVFDYDRLDDRSTIFEPDLRPEGIEYVLVNGELVADRGELTGARPGRVLGKDRLRKGEGVATTR
jgi:N-acyl-D-amino-acid deacylase